jgi:enoyl-[acyl-carrier protein] reductase II
MAEDILNTELCSMLGIKYPIMQAGMGYLARSELAAAVSEAGGLGVIGAASLTTELLTEEIRKVQAQTDNPFAVDILFAKMPSRKDNLIDGYTDEVNEFIEICFQENVPIIASGLGNPAQIVTRSHEAGKKVIALVGNVKNALRVEAGGVDLVVAQGHDAGGHTGRIGTMSLVPTVVDAVEVPVAAAGGIVDGRGLAASLMLGAIGVWCGTRFVATREAHSHDNYKNKICEINEEGTLVTRAYTGKTCRVIPNRFTDSWEGRDDEIEPFPLQGMKVGFETSVSARREGNTDMGSMPASQGSGMIVDVKSAGDVVQEMVEEAQRILSMVVKA